MEWVNLYTYLGECIESPTDTDLLNALKDVFKYGSDEHPDTWIECATEDEMLYSFAIMNKGTARYIKYSDVDMTEELETKEINEITIESGLNYWKKLIAGEMENL